MAADLRPADVPLTDMIACAKRELLMRKRVYPRRVEAGRMTQAEADKELAVMAAILARLEGPSLL